MRPLLICAILFASPLLRATPVSSGFDFRSETFTFANDTLWEYDTSNPGQLGIHGRDRNGKTPGYTRHCLVMTRAAIQFHRFAKFDASLPKVSDAEYAHLVRDICRIPASDRANKQVVIPGYPSLRAFSSAHAGLLQKEMGLWWPTYWRPGNWRMAGAFPPSHQRKIATQTCRAIEGGHPPVLFLTRFRPLNHAVIPYRFERMPDGIIRFTCYDPNNATTPVHLRFLPKTGRFELQKTGYWSGGQVNAFLVYRSRLG